MNLLKSKVDLSEDQACNILEQLLLTLDYMHKRNIVHRDIKLDNILINKIDDTDHIAVKIADFGLSAFLPEDPAQGLNYLCGTPSYMAPEMLAEGSSYREKADIFSAGSIFFNILTRRPLFSKPSMEAVLKMNKDCNLSEVSYYIAERSQSS